MKFEDLIGCSQYDLFCIFSSFSEEELLHAFFIVPDKLLEHVSPCFPKSLIDKITNARKNIPPILTLEDIELLQSRILKMFTALELI